MFVIIVGINKYKETEGIVKFYGNIIFRIQKIRSVVPLI